MLSFLGQLWGNLYLRIALVVVVGYVVYSYVLVPTWQVWSTIIVAYLIAYLLSPFVAWMERRVSRAVGMLAVALSLLLLLGLIWLLGIQIAAQLSTFVAQIPAFTETLQELPYLISRRIDPAFGAVFDQIYVSLQSLVRGLVEGVLPRLTDIRSGEGGVVRGLVTLAGGGARVGIVLVLSAYLLYNFPRYNRSFLRAFPHRHRPEIEEVMIDAGRSVGGYVRAQVLISVIVGGLTFLGLALVGIPLASALGLIAGIANLIPFLGPIITAVPTLLLAFTEGSGQVIGAIVVLAAINQIDGHLLSPMIFSRVISLDPVTVILAILLGAALFGFLGAVVAVPIAAFLKILYMDYYLESDWYKQARGE